MISRIRSLGITVGLASTISDLAGGRRAVGRLDLDVVEAHLALAGKDAQRHGHPHGRFGRGDDFLYTGPRERALGELGVLDLAVAAFADDVRAGHLPARGVDELYVDNGRGLASVASMFLPHIKGSGP